MPGTGYSIHAIAAASGAVLAETGPESIGYVIIAIGLVGLGLALVMLTIVSQRRRREDHH